MQPPPLPPCAHCAASERRGLRWGRLAATACTGAVLGVGAWVLRTVAPSAADFYPSCTFHTMTGLHCPGCGSTRCIHALLLGRLGEAAHQNLLLFCALPFIGYFGARVWWRWVQGAPPRVLPQTYPIWINWLGIAVFFLFGIVRNLPWAPFTYLAPY